MKIENANPPSKRASRGVHVDEDDDDGNDDDAEGDGDAVYRMHFCRYQVPRAEITSSASSCTYKKKEKRKEIYFIFT